jgi:hypothetical protein
MIYKIYYILLAFITIIFFVFVTFIIIPKHRVIAYDCRVAEISPDIPIDIKNQCRHIMSEKDLQKPK